MAQHSYKFLLLSQVSPPLVLVEVQSMLGILIELLVLLFAPPAPKFPPWDLNKHYTLALMLHLSCSFRRKRGTIIPVKNSKKGVRQTDVLNH